MRVTAGVLWLGLSWVGTAVADEPTPPTTPGRELPFVVRDVPDLGGMPVPMRLGLETLSETFDLAHGLCVERVVDGGRVPVASQLSPSGVTELVFLHDATGDDGHYVIVEGGDHVEAPTWSLRETARGDVEAWWQKAPVLGYCATPRLAGGLEEQWRRGSYIEPLFGPRGVPMLGDFPADHRHHRGVSWMWPRVLVGEESYDLWTLEGIENRFETWRHRVAGPVFAGLGVLGGWCVGDQKVVEEQVDLAIYSPRASGALVVDVTLRWRACAPDVRIAGQTEGEKGYGGFVVRMADAEEVRLHSPRGNEPAELVHEPFPWVAISGRLEGPEGPCEAGMAVLAHPDNLGHPNPWLMRFQGYVAESWPGLEPFALPVDGWVEARFRLIVFEGRPDTAELNAHFDLFCRPAIELVR